jgi:hypothetical protein
LPEQKLKSRNLDDYKVAVASPQWENGFKVLTFLTMDKVPKKLDVLERIDLPIFLILFDNAV